MLQPRANAMQTIAQWTRLHPLFTPHAFSAMVIVQKKIYYILVTAKSCDKETNKLFSPAVALG